MVYLAVALVLIFVLHLIDKHNRWRVTAKILAYPVATTVVLVGCFLGLSWYDEHKKDERIAQARAAAEAEQKKAVDACVERYKGAGFKTDRGTQVACEENSDSTPPQVQIDPSFGFIPDAQARKKVVKTTQLKVTCSADLTTTEAGSLNCGHVDVGEVVTLLVAHDSFVRILQFGSSCLPSA